VAKKPILSAEDVENMHITYKKEYAAPVDLEKVQKSENTTGHEIKTKKKKKYLLFLLSNIYA